MFDFLNSDIIMFVWILQILVFLVLFIVHVKNLKKITPKESTYFELGYLLIIFSCVYYVHVYYKTQLAKISNDLINKGNSLSVEPFAQLIIETKAFPVAEISLSFIIILSLFSIKLYKNKE